MTDFIHNLFDWLTLPATNASVLIQIGIMALLDHIFWRD